MKWCRSKRRGKDRRRGRSSNAWRWESSSMSNRWSRVFSASSIPIRGSILPCFLCATNTLSVVPFLTYVALDPSAVWLVAFHSLLFPVTDRKYPCPFASSISDSSVSCSSLSSSFRFLFLDITASKSRKVARDGVLISFDLLHSQSRQFSDQACENTY